jgi:hypothetical protein
VVKYLVGEAMTENLQREFEYYLQNQKALAQKYNGKVLVIKGQTVIGVFDSELEAVQQTSENHELGTFLVQKCDATPESYTQSYHSRVVFT